MTGDAAEAAALEELRDCVLLGTAVLEQQPSTAAQMLRSLGNDGLERVESRGPGDERERRLGGECRERGIVVRDVRRVGDHDVEGSAGHGVEPGSQSKGDVRQREARTLSRATPKAPGDTSTPTTRASGRSEAMASATAPLPVPRSSTARSADFGKCSKAASTSSLGFRPRHEHGRRDLERQRPEFAPAGR